MNGRSVCQLTWLLLSLFPMPSQAQDARKVVEPVVPPVCSVLVARAPPLSGATDDSDRIQKAINDCPPGRALRLAMGNGQQSFTSGPLVLKSRVTLLIDAGVTLFASTNPHAYELAKRTCGTNDAHGHGCRPFIEVENAEASGIMGEGVIDGQGGHRIDGKAESWWQIARRAQKEGSRQNVPRLIEVSRSREFTLYRITLRNSPNFHVALNRVDGFTAWGVRIDSPADARNTDGIDPISSRNVTIAHSFIRTGDDNIAIKAGRNGPAENISILHNHFYNGHGMSIGSESDGGVRNVLVENLSMDGATSGLRIKSDISRGGLVSNVRYRYVCLRNVRAPLDIDARYDRQATGNKIPNYTDIVFEHIRSITPGRIILRGFDAGHPLVARMDDVVIDGNSSVDASHASLTLGPGPVHPIPSGENVQVHGDTSSRAGENCDQRLVPFAEIPAATVVDRRPLLTAAQAKAYAYAEVLKHVGIAGSERIDPWDPLADPLTTNAIPIPDYTVDANAVANGQTVFNTVQSAVSKAAMESNASGRKNRIYIMVKPGIYRELLYVPVLAAPITIYGSDAKAANTRIGADLDALVSGRRYSEMFGKQFAATDPAITAMHNSIKDRAIVGTPGSAVAWIKNNGFHAKNLTFENIYNKTHGDAFTETGTPAIHSQAVALMVDDADKVQFENVRFSSFQDTLYLKSSSPQIAARSFFNKSYIEGDLDFIFGEATGYFYQSEIKSLGDRRIAYVTAPSTHVNSKFGFVFEACQFTHDHSENALAGNFKLTRQWFRGQRCTPFGAVAALADYSCRLGTVDRYDAPSGTISRGALESVGKVIILNSRIGAHIDKARPWADWNASGMLKYRPVQFDSDDYWNNLTAAGIAPIGHLGYVARKQPVEPFLAEFNNTDE